MNSFRSRFSHGLVILLIAFIPLSCGQNPLPEVTAFEELGFEDALDAVRRQMLNSYQRWQKEPDNAERNGTFGMMLSAYGKDAASEIFFRRARLLEPAEFRWAYYLAVANRQLGRYEEAAGIFREALIIDPDSIEARMQLAGVLLQTNEISASVEMYRSITAQLPERVDGWLGLGKALDRSGDLAAAVIALRRAKDLGAQYGDVRYALAGVLSASGDKEGAAREFAAYEERLRNKINTSDRFIRAVIRLNASDGPFLAKADYQIARGQFGEAVRFFRQALEINPVNQDAWGGLTFAQGKLGDRDATRESYEAALAAGIQYKRLHFTYAEALREWQQLDAARDVMSKAIELDPQYTEALLVMGELEIQRGAHAAAVEYYRRAAAVVPNDRNIWFSLAQALNAAGQFQEAATQLNALTSDPALDKARTLKELAVAYHGMQHKDEAIDALKRSREVARKAYRTTMVETLDALLAEWYPGSTATSP